MPIKPLRIALTVMLSVLPIQAEYCIDWKSWLQGYAGQSGHCWSSESECNSYYFSRCMNSNYKNDCAGPCYFKPGLYPKTGAAKAKQKENTMDTALQKAAEETKKKQDALKKATEQKQFNTEKEKLLSGMKGGVSASSVSNQIILKPIPPALSQLHCVGNNEANRSWEQHAPNCIPIIPNIPEPGIPVEATGTTLVDSQMLSKFIESLHQRVSTTRESLAKQDTLIKALEKEIAQKEMKAPDIKTPKGESDALKRAKEVLAKAKADRERTAQELTKLEQQEKEAHNRSKGNTP